MGMKDRFGNLKNLSMATRIRMLLNEKALGQLNLQDDIRRAWVSSDRVRAAWQRWYDNGIVLPPSMLQKLRGRPRGSLSELSREGWRKNSMWGRGIAQKPS